MTKFENTFDMTPLAPEVTLPAYVVMTNTDLTEGRGYSIPASVATNPVTAARLAKGVGVMGSTADVVPCFVFKIRGMWYGPVNVAQPTKEDEAKNARREFVLKVRQRALELGLTVAEVDLLMSEGKLV